MSDHNNLATLLERLRTARDTAERDARVLLASLVRLEAAVDAYHRAPPEDRSIEESLNSLLTCLDDWHHASVSAPEFETVVEVSDAEDLPEVLVDGLEDNYSTFQFVLLAVLVRLIQATEFRSWTETEADVMRRLIELHAVQPGPPSPVVQTEIEELAEVLMEVDDLEDLALEEVLEQWFIEETIAEWNGPEVDAAVLAEQRSAVIDELGTSDGDYDVERLQAVIETLSPAASDARSVAAYHSYSINILRSMMALQYPDTDSPADPLPWIDDRQHEVGSEPTGSVPVVFLPIRLQTRFRLADQPATPEIKWDLAIRIYPDDIHADTHEPELTYDEIAWGTYFWKAIWWTWLPADSPTDPAVVASEEGLDGLDPRSLPTESATRHGIVKERVWNQLVERYGRERAAWVKHRLSPPNGDHLLVGPPEDDSMWTVPSRPDFEAIAGSVPESPGSWTRQPTAELLPDRWVAFAEIDGEVVTAYSRPVPDRVAVGPDPDMFTQATTSTSAPDRDDTGVDLDQDTSLFGTGTEWLFDFDAAVDVGMGIEMPLTEEQVDSGVDRLLVLGVSTTTGGTDGAASFKRLLDSHHYTDGLSFVPQGTQTNNADEGGAGQPDEGTSSLDAECEAPLVSTVSTLDRDTDPVDGAVVARMLGLDPTMLGKGADSHVFGHVANADATEQTDSYHLQTALWSGMLGYYVPHMFMPDPADTDTVSEKPALLSWLDAYREHFIDYVRARGPLPAIRVGDQPYGLLPVLDLEHWEHLPMADDRPALTDSQKETRRDESAVPRLLYRPGTETFERDLVERVRGLRRLWEDGLTNVPSYEASDDAGEALVDLLQMEAHAYGYRVRTLVGRVGAAALRTDRPLSPADEGWWDTLRADDEVIDLLLEQIEALESTSTDVLRTVTEDVDETEPPRIARFNFNPRTAPTNDVINPLVTESTASFIDQLLALAADPDDGISETTGLRRGPPTGVPVEMLRWLDDSFFDQLAPILDLRSDLLQRGATALELLLYYALLQEYVLARVRVGHLYIDPQLREADQPDPGWGLLPEREAYSKGSSTLWERLNDPLSSRLEELIEDDRNELDVGETYWTALASSPELDHSLDASLRSLRWLRSVEPAALEQLLLETLDLVSHRYDAWATSIATRQLDRLREQRGLVGLNVGGYGFVENLTRQEPEDQSFGYVHAPSLSHATTAAVLRSGHLAHEDDELGELLAIDLSADRVRGAKGVIDAVGNGKQLGALLGYRFERGLHEGHEGVELNQFVPVFRKLAPLTTGKQERTVVGDDGEDDSAQTAAAEDRVALRDTLDGLALYRLWNADGITWGGEGDMELPATGTTEHSAIVDEFERLGDLIDAIEDVLTAESVHQLVNGQGERAGASLDALARGESPPDLEVTETPRSGRTATHRLLVLFDDTPTDLGLPDSPRARAEPILESWAGQLLGEFSRVCCLVVADAPSTDTDAAGTGGGEAVAADPIYLVIRLDELDLSALDVLSVVQGDMDAQRSELEQRIVHHVRRTAHDTVGDRRLDLWFEPLDTWEDRLEGTETSLAELGVDATRDLSVGELLAVALRIQSLVSSCRPASARDLQLPAETGEEAFDPERLRVRADLLREDLFSVFTQLDGLVHALRPVSEDDPNCVRVLERELSAFRSDDAGSTADRTRDITVAGLLDDIETWLEQSEPDRPGVLLEDIESFADAYPEFPGRSELRNAVEAITHVRTELRTFIQHLTRDTRGPWRLDPNVRRLARILHEIDETLERLQRRLGGQGPLRRPPRESRWWRADIERLVELVDNARKHRRRRENDTDAPDRRTSTVPESLRHLIQLYRRLAAVATTQTAFETATGDVKVERLRAARDVLATMDEVSASDLASIDLLLESLDDDFLASIDPTMDGLSFLRAESDGEGDQGNSNLHRDTVLRLEQLLVQHASEPERQHFEGELQGLFQSLELDLRRLDRLVTDVARLADVFVRAAAEGLRTVLLQAAAFGVYGSIPLSARGHAPATVRDLALQGESVATELKSRYDDAEPAPGSDSQGTSVDEEIGRLHALLGEAFVLLPPFSVPGSGLFADGRAQDLLGNEPLAPETWFHRIARVREKPRMFQHVLTLGETLGEPMANRFTVEQLPDQPGQAWLGREAAWEGGDAATEEQERMSIVAHVPESVDPTGNVLSGIFIDEWIETIPDTTETTGISFHFDTPGSEPPQALVLAVPSNDDPWTLQSLAETLGESLDLAKLRLVDWPALQSAGHMLPGLCFAENHTGGLRAPDAPSISFDRLSQLGDT